MQGIKHLGTFFTALTVLTLPFIDPFWLAAVLRTVRIRIVYCLFWGHAACFYIWLGCDHAPFTIWGPTPAPKNIPAAAEICLLGSRVGGSGFSDWAFWVWVAWSRSPPSNSIQLFARAAGKLSAIVSVQCVKFIVMTATALWPRLLTSDCWPGDRSRPPSHELWPGMRRPFTRFRLATYWCGVGLIAALICETY